MAYADKDKERAWHRESMRRQRAANPDKFRERSRELYKKNVEKYREKSRKAVRKHRLKTKYNMSVEQYEALVTSQGNKCAVCKTSDMGHAKEWSVDHCHKSGKVRGLLCQPCNTALGLAREDPAILRALANYIEVHK